MAQVRVTRPWFGVFFLALALAMTAGMVSWTVAGEPRVGVLTGRITDRAGDPIEGVYVTVPAVNTDETRRVITGIDGRWRAAQTPIGYHELSANRRGFQPSTFSSGFLEEGKVLETPTIVMFPAADQLSLGVNYPRTVIPGGRKRLQVYGTWKEPEARVHFAVYPFDIVAARTRTRGSQSYQEQFLSTIDRSQPALMEWDRTYTTDDSNGEFTGWPSTPKLEKPGGYLIVAFLGDLKAGDALNVTTLAVVVKRDGGQVLSWATDVTSGKPVAGSTVEIYEDGVQKATGVTDAAGLSKVPYSGDEPLTVVA
ncbi:MAG: carboxypeptidase regulatory-like domain-containing protein, partial [Armatimonadota bacterium]